MFRTNMCALACSLFLLSGATSIAEVKSVKIDPTKSTLAWVGKKVTGQHSGVVGVKNGTAELNDGKLVGGTFDIDMSTIAVKDITDPKNNKKLADHLKSPDFFSAEDHPSAKFIITKAIPNPAAAAGQPNYTVSGTLDIKGISNQVTFPATVTISDKTARATGTAVLDRTKWEVRYGSGKFFQGLGDKLIYDDFEVTLDVVGNVG